MSGQRPPEIGPLCPSNSNVAFHVSGDNEPDVEIYWDYVNTQVDVRYGSDASTAARAMFDMVRVMIEKHIKDLQPKPINRPPDDS